MKKYLIPFMALPLFLASCGQAERPSAEGLHEDIIPVEILPLDRQASVQQIKTSGVFTTDNEAVLSFKNGGVVSKVYVKEGDAVKAGQVLATLNPTEINASVRQAKLSEEKAQRDYERARKLYQDSVATLEQFQNAETALHIAQEQLRAANFNQGQSSIRAEADGYVLKRFVNDGQIVGPGTAVLQVNATGNSTWQLKVGVSDAQWAAIAIGDTALLSSTVFEDEVTAVVYKKTEGIDPASGVFNVMLKVVSPTNKLKIGAGMFAEATIKTRKQAAYWHIPYDAILDGDAGAASVFITNDNKTAKRVQVKIANVQQKQVEVSSGLEGANSLIISGSAYLTDGSPIKVVK